MIRAFSRSRMKKEGAVLGRDGRRIQVFFSFAGLVSIPSLASPSEASRWRFSRATRAHPQTRTNTNMGNRHGCAERQQGLEGGGAHAGSEPRWCRMEWNRTRGSLLFETFKSGPAYPGNRPSERGLVVRKRQVTVVGRNEGPSGERHPARSGFGGVAGVGRGSAR